MEVFVLSLAVRGGESGNSETIKEGFVYGKSPKSIYSYLKNGTLVKNLIFLFMHFFLF
jgi:hypothetical protein